MFIIKLKTTKLIIKADKSYIAYNIISLIIPISNKTLLITTCITYKPTRIAILHIKLVRILSSLPFYFFLCNFISIFSIKPLKFSVLDKNLNHLPQELQYIPILQPPLSNFQTISLYLVYLHLLHLNLIIYNFLIYYLDY